MGVSKNRTSSTEKDDSARALSSQIREISDGPDICLEDFTPKVISLLDDWIGSDFSIEHEWIEPASIDTSRVPSNRMTCQIAIDSSLALQMTFNGGPEPFDENRHPLPQPVQQSLSASFRTLVDREELRLREALSSPIALFTQRRQYDNLLKVLSEGTQSAFSAIGSIGPDGRVHFLCRHPEKVQSKPDASTNDTLLEDLEINDLSVLSADVGQPFENTPLIYNLDWNSTTFDRNLHNLLICPIRSVDHICGVLLLADCPRAYSPVTARLTRRLSECLCPFLQADNARRQSHQKMEESLETLETILDVSAQGAWIWDIDSGETIYDRRWARMLGYAVDELNPHVSTWETMCHPGDYPRACQRLESHWQDPEQPYEVELRMRHKEGHWIWIWARGRTVLRDEKGRPKKMVGTHLDISEMKQLQTDLEEARATVEAASKAKDEFITVMSHEMRTPLNPIIGFSDLLAEEIEKPEQLDYLAAIKNGGERLNRLIGDVLNYAKMTRTSFQEESYELNLAEFVEDTVHQMSPACRSNRFFLEWMRNPHGGRMIDDKIRVRGPFGAIHQILTHLITNAFKFTDDGTVTLKVGLGPESTDDQACFRAVVEDDGRGMDPQEVDRLMEPFETAQSVLNRDKEGIGLGLAITQKILDAIDGRIRVSSHPGKGSRFEVEIPLEVVAS